MIIIDEGLTIAQQDKDYVFGMLHQSRTPKRCSCNC